LSKERSKEDLKIGIAGFYDRSSKLWEEVWGEVRYHSSYTKAMAWQWTLWQGDGQDIQVACKSRISHPIISLCLAPTWLFTILIIVLAHASWILYSRGSYRPCPGTD
jgi:hypothetical protein